MTMIFASKSSYKSLFIYFEIEKKGGGVVQGSDYILVRSSCIYILQHDTNVSMYLDGVTVMSFVLKKAISIQYILYLLSAPTHPPSSRGNSRRRTGNLFSLGFTLFPRHPRALIFWSWKGIFKVKLYFSSAQN